MNILVWKSHGEIDVYCAETPQQLINIAGMITDIVCSYSNEYSAACSKLMEEIHAIKNCSDRYVKIKRLISEFIYDWVQNSDDDNFERIFFDKVKY